MLFDIYTLPYLVVNAGCGGTFRFGVFNDDGGAVQNATYQCDITEYCNEGEPIASWIGNVTYDTVDKASSISLTFDAERTAQWNGKYIYQLTIALQNGSPAEIRKGILFVRGNISSAA